MAKVKNITKVSDTDAISFIWARSRHMPSGEYFFFKQLHKVVSWYKKELSDEQRKILDGYLTQYELAPLTPKPKKKSQIKVIHEDHIQECDWCQANSN